MRVFFVLAQRKKEENIFFLALTFLSLSLPLSLSFSLSLSLSLTPSHLRYEGVRSPYIYPMYGLGELPQAFARLAAVHGVSESSALFFLF